MSITRKIQPKLHFMSGGLFGNWLPGNSVEVGDYGVIRDSRFERSGTLNDYGANIVARPDRSGTNDVQFMDRATIKPLMRMSGGLGRGVLVRIGVSLSDQGAFLYHLANVATLRPASSRDFDAAVRQLLLSDKFEFPDDGVIVTEVLKAGKATILVADGQDVELNLHASFEPLGDAFLAGADGKVACVKQQGSVFQFVAQDDINAMLRLVRPVILAPPGSPGGGGGLKRENGIVERTIGWFKSLLEERELAVAELVIRQKSENARWQTSILAGPDPDRDQFIFEMRDVSLEEMSTSDAPEVVVSDEETPVIETMPIQKKGEASG